MAGERLLPFTLRGFAFPLGVSPGTLIPTSREFRRPHHALPLHPLLIVKLVERP